MYIYVFIYIYIYVCICTSDDDDRLLLSLSDHGNSNYIWNSLPYIFCLAHSLSGAEC